MAQFLSSPDFMSISPTAVVNLDAVEAIIGSHLLLESGRSVVIKPPYQQKVRRQFAAMGLLRNEQ